jgi:hypothetical protein
MNRKMFELALYGGAALTTALALLPAPSRADTQCIVAACLMDSGAWGWCGSFNGTGICPCMGYDGTWNFSDGCSVFS